MTTEFTNRQIAALRRLPLDVRVMLAPLLSLPQLVEDRRGKHWAERRAGLPPAPEAAQKLFKESDADGRRKLMRLYDFGPLADDQKRFDAYLKAARGPIVPTGARSAKRKAPKVLRGAP